MKHFFLAAGGPEKKEIVFKAADYHYLKNVRRLKIGDSFTGIDEQGRLYTVRICSDSPGELKAHLEQTTAGLCGGVRIVLYQALLKGKKLDNLVRQLTEAGVGKIVPLICEHTIVKVKDGFEENKIQRWKRIAREALQQSGRTLLPEICEPRTLDSIKSLEGVKLFFHQQPSLPERSLHRYLAGKPDTVRLVIGPEGGFSGNETRRLEEYGFKPAYLGQNVLRAETAALFALAAVQMILLERNVWRLI